MVYSSDNSCNGISHPPRTQADMPWSANEFLLRVFCLRRVFSQKPGRPFLGNSAQEARLNRNLIEAMVWMISYLSPLPGCWAAA